MPNYIRNKELNYLELFIFIHTVSYKNIQQLLEQNVGFEHVEQVGVVHRSNI